MKKFDTHTVAALSRLDASQTVRGSLCSDMDSIEEFVGALPRIDERASSDIPKSYTVLRKDVVKESLPKEEFLSSAPLKDADFIVVPRTVGERDE